MTFKHTRFEDSQIMRSLERISVEKGFVKEASKQTKSIHDLVKDKLIASDNLNENIIKLCNHLRKEGFNHYASELEEKFINYKTAQTLYETSKEKGEDLIHAAHPKGSHKLEGIEGGHIVKTVVDRHKDLLNIVNKKPTGKLSTAEDVIKSVKIVLGEDVSQLETQLKTSLKEASDKIKKIIDRVSKDSTKWLKIDYKPIWDQVINNPTYENINSAKKWISFIEWEHRPHLISGMSEEVWAIVEPTFNEIKKIYDNALELLKKIDSLKYNTSYSPAENKKDSIIKTTETNFEKNINSKLEYLNSSLRMVEELNEPIKTKVKPYINKRISELSSLKSEFDTKIKEISEDGKNDLSDRYDRILNYKLRNSKFDEFSNWLNNTFKSEGNI